jgi:hypothetical protein
MGLSNSFRCGIYPDDHQELPKIKNLFEAVLPLLGAVFLCFSGCTTVPKSTSVDFSSVSASVDSIDRSIDKAIHAKSVQAAKPVLVEAKKEVAVAQQQIAEVHTQALQVEGQRDWWQKDAQVKQTKISTLETRVSHLEHLLFLCSALISIVAGGIGWSLFKDVPYGAWIVGGIVLGSFTTSWFALGHLL